MKVAQGPHICIGVRFSLKNFDVLTTAVQRLLYRVLVDFIGFLASWTVLPTKALLARSYPYPYPAKNIG